jgi:hypothetical protein
VRPTSPQKINGGADNVSLLPQSDALREAKADSISDLFNRDVEGLSDVDLDRIIAELRANRERFAAAEAAGAKAPRTPAMSKSAVSATLQALRRPQLNISSGPKTEI